eukprot:gb/GECH01013853.1/.p1 GENE.gb/GECH01013853.1/~~gb/GECH01013853.1/.p1  ORF type:complete len:581 (+),score=104.72 gb/GECH01013853.1/:1-1743(+)
MKIDHYKQKHRFLTTIVYWFILGALLFSFTCSSGVYAHIDSDDPSSPKEHASSSSSSVQEPKEAEESWDLLVILITVTASVFITYFFLRMDLKYLPDSIATIVFSMLVGAVFRINEKTLDQIFRLESDTFFLFLLPPIIFESGYNLHKGNFFKNIGSIMSFAVLGTLISSVFIGCFIYLFDLLPLIDSLIFGALISSVDPVATLAIFQALDVPPTLYMLVFGESVLNDAISIVLFKTLLLFFFQDFSGGTIFEAIYHFFVTFFGSVFIGVISGLITALIFKHSKLKHFVSLELSVFLILSYVPYLIAESLDLSGIMAILFTGIINSHYTHFSLSTHTQITTQQLFRMIAYISETIVFAYLGLAVFSFDHVFNVALIISGTVLVFAARAANIFPLSAILNRFRSTQISPKTQFIMWFSGLRGAIAFALALMVPGSNKKVIITTTLIIVLITIIVLGGSTMPILKLLHSEKDIVVSKNAEQAQPVVDPKTQSPVESNESFGLFEKFDNRYLQSFFRAKPTSKQRQMLQLQTIDDSQVSRSYFQLEAIEEQPITNRTPNRRSSSYESEDDIGDEDSEASTAMF